MQQTFNDYYSDTDGSLSLLAIEKEIEKGRIALLAELALMKKKTIKRNYDKKNQTVINQTKTDLSRLEGQFDTAIKGQFQKKVKRVVKQKLEKYDRIQ